MPPSGELSANAKPEASSTARGWGPSYIDSLPVRCLCTFN
jgi:hypothetical protein